MFVFGGDLLSLGSVGQLVNVAFYFIPPVIAMFLCHLASGRVYEQLRPSYLKRAHNYQTPSLAVTTV